MARRRLLPDTMSLGLSPLIVCEMFVTIRRVNDVRTAVPLVEQSVSMALRLGPLDDVQDEGRMVAEGTFDEPVHRDGVRCACLGA